MTHVNTMHAKINERFSSWIETATLALGELTVEVKPDHLLELCRTLKSDQEFLFDMLIDVCGIDYLHYGLDDWQTTTATESGFSRGTTQMDIRETPKKPCRFAVVYHLLSTRHNHRIRLRVNIPNHADIIVDSVEPVWPAANWFEREAFDLYGILFRHHPDLRRLLTDYGFVGHPFRKDFPLVGKVEARYDAKLRRVVYEDVSIKLRILEPKVIRHDSRYAEEEVK